MRNLTVSIADLHCPMIHWPTVAAAFDFLEKNPEKIARFIFQGDAFDNACISHHTKGKPLFRLPGSYLKDRRLFEDKILTPLEGLLEDEVEKVFIKGNHERFEDDLIEEHPEFEGLVSHVDGLKLEERGWEIIPLGHAKRIGDLDVIHGEVLSGIGNQAGAFPSKKALDLYDHNVLAAHTHAPQSYSKVSPVDAKKKRMGWIAPIAGSTNPTYLRNRPTAWVNGFTIIEHHPNGKSFNLYPIVVTEGKFSFGGTIYGKQ